MHCFGLIFTQYILAVIMPVMLIMLPHEDMNWGWNNPSVWSFESGTAPTQKNLFVHIDIACEKYQKPFGFTFPASIFISAAEMVWQQTRSFTEK